MSDTTELKTPQRIALMYRYERILGEGSNGKTYLAIDRKTGKQVAIKALKLVQRENFKSFELFKREAETLSSIHVPGVPQFYQSILAKTIGDECYIIQEYINAPSIQSYLNDGRVFSESETLTIMQKVASILHILHSQYSPPVIHRDIKPSNLLCRLPEESDTASWQAMPIYLIDFGAVANAHSNSDKSTIAGTIGYMAPEQNFGESQPQTDLYALGATALHMLTGVAPYEMDYDTYSLKYEEALDQYAPKTSAGMRELLGRLLNYAIDKRPATSADLMRMIANVREGLPLDESSEAMPARGLRGAIRQILADAKREKTPKLVVLRKILKQLRSTTRELGLGSLPPMSYYTMLKHPAKYADNLRAAWGTLTNYSSAEFTPGIDTTLLEFTFNVDGVTWSGMSRLPALIITKEASASKRISDARQLTSVPVKLVMETEIIKMQKKLDLVFPMPCLVVYHPDDPSCCRLISIDPYAIIRKASASPVEEHGNTNINWKTDDFDVTTKIDWTSPDFMADTNINSKPQASERTPIIAWESPVSTEPTSINEASPNFTGITNDDEDTKVS